MHPLISNVSAVLLQHGFTASEPRPHAIAGFQVLNDRNGDISVVHMNSKDSPEATLRRLEAYRDALEPHWHVMLDVDNSYLLITAWRPA